MVYICHGFFIAITKYRMEKRRGVESLVVSVVRLCGLRLPEMWVPVAIGDS